jgi:hypothetical protein
MAVDSMDYAGNMIYSKMDVGTTHGAISLNYHFDGGYRALNRVVVNGVGTVELTNDYYAYGGPWGDTSTGQGKGLTSTTDARCSATLHY